MDYKTRIKQLEKRVKRYRKLSLVDSLTGLFNRRKLLTDIKRYLNLQKRFKIPFFIVMIDLDRFKTINDTKGHNAGDRLLRKVAKVLCNSIRDYENVYRGYKGDEFFIIFSHSNKEIILKEKVKTALIKNKIKASIGICKLGKNCLKKVDYLMYKDKQNKGGNK